MSSFTDRVGLTREQLRAAIDEQTRIRIQTKSAVDEAAMRRFGEEFRRESATTNNDRRRMA